MNALLQLDHALFLLLNGRWHNPLFDAVLPVWRNSLFWLPLYTFLLFFLVTNFRKCWWMISYVVVTVALCDTVSSAIIKNLVWRDRPCRAMAGQVRFLVEYCPMSSSFTSSHATNHFGISVLLFLMLRPFIGRWAWGFIAWAASICYAQIYVGVHYPADVTAGALVGTLLGWLMYRLFCYHPGPMTPADLRTAAVAGKVSQNDAL